MRASLCFAACLSIAYGQTDAVLSAKEQVTDSAEWFSKQAKTWNECAVTHCKYDLTNGETQVFSTVARNPTHFLRRSSGSLDRSIQSRNRAMLNDNDNYGSEHYHCEHDASHQFQCKCSCSDETNCYSVKHSDRHVKVCDGQVAETQYLLSKNHETTIAAIANDPNPTGAHREAGVVPPGALRPTKTVAVNTLQCETIRIAGAGMDKSNGVYVVHGNYRGTPMWCILNRGAPDCGRSKLQKRNKDNYGYEIRTNPGDGSGNQIRYKPTWQYKNLDRWASTGDTVVDFRVDKLAVRYDLNKPQKNGVAPGPQFITCLKFSDGRAVPMEQTCEDSCHPDGTYTGEGDPTGCTANYCTQYQSGGGFHDRCTAGHPGHNYALEECQKTCGICSV
jgi:hypothetical protein